MNQYSHQLNNIEHDILVDELNWKKKDVFQEKENTETHAIVVFLKDIRRRRTTRKRAKEIDLISNTPVCVHISIYHGSTQSRSIEYGISVMIDFDRTYKQ